MTRARAKATPLPVSVERTASRGVQTRDVDLHYRFHIEHETGNRALVLVDCLDCPSIPTCAGGSTISLPTWQLLLSVPLRRSASDRRR